MRLPRRSHGGPLVVVLILLLLSSSLVHDAGAQRPLSISDLMDAMLEGSEVLRGAFTSAGRFRLGNGARFSRMRNGDILATVPLPVLEDSSAAEGAPEDGGGGGHRSIAATTLRGGASLRVDASAHAHKGGALSRASLTFSLPERVVAVRSAAFGKGSVAEIVLIPASGQDSAHLPAALEAGDSISSANPTGHEISTSASSKRVTLQTGDTKVVTVREGAGSWRLGAIVVSVACLAVVMVSRRRRFAAASKGFDSGESANLTQVLSQRGLGGRERDEVVLFEARRNGSGNREKTNEKVS